MAINKSRRETSEEPTCRHTLILDFQPLNCETENFCCSTTPSVVLRYGSPCSLIHHPLCSVNLRPTVQENVVLNLDRLLCFLNSSPRRGCMTTVSEEIHHPGSSRECAGDLGTNCGHGAPMLWLISQVERQ